MVRRDDAAYAAELAERAQLLEDEIRALHARTERAYNPVLLALWRRFTLWQFRYKFKQRLWAYLGHRLQAIKAAAQEANASASVSVRSTARAKSAPNARRGR